MRLESLSLRQFRNYGSLDITLDGDLFLLLGANGQGKTNLLEAIGLVVTGRSPRTNRYQELIRWGHDMGIVKARAVRRDSPIEVEVRLRAQGPHSFFVQGKAVRRTSEVLGHIRAVFFFPDDLQLVKGGPALRRRFLDLQLTQLKAAYRERLISYQRVLKQRNAVLADARPGEDLTARLAPWDEQLVALGAYIMEQRAAAIRYLAERAVVAYHDVSGGKERLDLAYRPFWLTEPAAPASLSSDEAADALPGDAAAWRTRFREAMERRRGEEIARRMTLVGPQRDDFDIYLNGRPARSFASQGQQRSIVLALKVAEVDHLDAETGEPPLLLLDDVFSELDHQRRLRLLEAVGPRGQVFITATGLDAWPEADPLRVKIFDVISGTVRERPCPP